MFLDVVIKETLYLNCGNTILKHPTIAIASFALTSSEFRVSKNCVFC
jgi:hypothetical protein